MALREPNKISDLLTGARNVKPVKPEFDPKNPPPGFIGDQSRNQLQTTKPVADPTKSTIKFNEDKSVDYTPKGSTETVNLSAGEYDALKAAQNPASKFGSGGNVQTEKTQAILQKEQQKPLQPTAPFTEPPPVPGEQNINTFDALDIGKVIGGAAAGATLGSFAGLPGAIVGGIGGALSTLIYSQASDKKQLVTAARTEFTTSTANMQTTMNRLNAGLETSQQARANWDNEYQRILRAQRTLKRLSAEAFGDKLAKTQDEQAKIEAWLRNYPILQFEFEQALANSGGMMRTDIASPETVQND